MHSLSPRLGVLVCYLVLSMLVVHADMDSLDSFESFVPQETSCTVENNHLSEASKQSADLLTPSVVKSESLDQSSMDAEPVAMDSPGEAAFHEGVMAYTGNDGLVASKEAAYQSFKLSAKSGYLPGMHALASLYTHGLGDHPPHFKAAAFWLSKAALRGYAPSQAALSCLYSEGKGVEQNAVIAFYWMEKAARQGLAEAQYEAGYAYEMGEGVEQNTNKALEWYLKAAKQGNVFAQVNAGRIYLTGEAGDVDNKRAYDCFTQAMVQGNSVASHYLGYMYLHGCGVDVNLQKAVAFYERSANAGYEPSQITLAEVYMKANEDLQDYTQALKWALTAAKNNSSNGQWLIGFIFSAGKGVAQDLQEGYAWSLMSESQGNERAAAFRKKIEKALNPESISQARERAKAIWSKLTNEEV